MFSPKNHASKKMKAEIKKQSGSHAMLVDEHRALQNQVASQEGIIEMLKMQLEQQANVSCVIRLTDWLMTDWLIDWLVDWLID